MTKEAFSIRRYSKNDKLEVLQLLDLNIPYYFAPAEKTDFQNYLETEIELYYVLTFENKIIGCGGINFEDEKKTGIISWDIIHPEFQGKKFGKALLQYRISVLKSLENVTKIIVRTSQMTFLFYQKQGFQLLEVKPNYWAKGFDLYFMEYVLRNSK
jgi:N-acetylglutamate synthase-like GNAT family acetyltransferase